MCNHCENPVCLEGCPVDEVEGKFTWPDQSVETFLKRATYRRPDGVVLIDYERCIGCGACVDLCPYKARFLNPARKNGGKIHRDKIYRCLQSALKKIGLQGNVHKFRHTFASHLVMKGVGIETVSKLLGHSSIEMTMKYAHLAPDHLRKAVDLLIDD